jgi:hypothetical protein
MSMTVTARLERGAVLSALLASIFNAGDMVSLRTQNMNLKNAVF